MITTSSECDHQYLEWFRPPFNQLAQGVLAHHYESIPGLVHLFDDARAGAEPEALGSW
jgi:hypothetical protein